MGIPPLGRFQVYLLAAGRGRRAGGPKAWKVHEGRPLLEKQLEFLLGLFPPQRIAVSIQPEWAELCRKLNPHVNWIPVNPDATPLGVLITLIKSLFGNQRVPGITDSVGWSFVYHVDMPLWEKALFGTLTSQIPALEPTLEAIVPSYLGRKGHPVLLSPGLQEKLLKLDPKLDRLDYYLRTCRQEIVELPFPVIHENWNDLKHVSST